MTTNNFKIAFISLLICYAYSSETTDQSNEQSVNLIPVSERWGFGFLAGLGVSALGFICAIVVVKCKDMASDACFEITIKFLFSLAFGALLGDAMIHLMPDGYSNPEVDSRVTAGIFIGSILFFIILERIFAALGITHKHWHGEDCHDDHEGAITHHDHPRKIHNEDVNQSESISNTKKLKSLKSSQIDFNDNINPSHEHICKNHDHHKHDHKHGKEAENEHGNDENSNENDKNEERSCLENLKGKGTAGYMNLLGSLIHNSMDGLALGVAFATGDSGIFVPILVAIIAHEIPREMGDVAILMTNEFSSIQTILCNGIVNLSSLIGVFIGLAISELNEVAKIYILIFVAGNFIFIAADIWKNLFKNSSFIKNLIEFLGFGVGIAAMYLILLLESDKTEGTG